MAKAYEQIEVVPVTKTEERKHYNLKLTEREAVALLYLVGCVYGSYDTSLRRHTSAVYDALSKAGVPQLVDKVFDQDHSIDFSKLPLSLVAEYDHTGGEE